MKINKLLIGLAISAGLTSCTEDFKNWMNPQSNAAQEIAEKFVMAVQPTVSSVKFAEIAEDSIQLFTTNLQQGQTAAYDITITGDGVDGIQTLTATTDGKVAKEDLANAVNMLYGKAPVERTLNMGISSNVTIKTADCSVNTVKTADYTLLATPDAPVISSAYYLIGNMCDWKPAEMIKFTHSDKDVYEDPVFTVIFTTNGADNYWKIIPQSNVDAGDTWKEPGVLGTEVDGDESMSGILFSQAGVKAGKLAEAGKYKLEINMLEGTYKFTLIPPVPEYYIVGRQNNWKMSLVSSLYPLSGTTASYTSYFTNAWDCRIATPANAAAGTWNDDFGATSNGCTDATGSLVEHSDNCIASPGAGYYTITADFEAMTYTWTKIEGIPTSYDKIGIVGCGDDWDNDIFLTKVEGSGDLGGNDTHNWSALGVELKAATWGFKFRANASWDANWGKGAVTTAGNYVYGDANGDDNIPLVEPGIYNVYFNDMTGQFFMIKQ